MFEQLKQYADEGYLRFERDNIWFGKERVSLYFVLYSASEFAINRKINGWKYLATKFLVSRKEGRVLIQQHGARDMKSLSSLLDANMTVMNIFGMGRFKVVSTDNTTGLAVISGTSTLGLGVKDDKPTDEPVDFVIGGILAGAVGYYMKSPAYAFEVACVSQNNVNECMWLVGSRQSIIDHVQKFYTGKAELAKDTLDQIEAAEKELAGRYSLKAVI